MHPLPPRSRLETSDRFLHRDGADDHDTSTIIRAAAAVSGPAIVDGQFDDASEDGQRSLEKSAAPETKEVQSITLQKQQQPPAQHNTILPTDRANNIICNSQVHPNNFNHRNMGTGMMISPPMPAYMPFVPMMMMVPLPLPLPSRSVKHHCKQTQQRNQASALLPLAPRPTSLQPKRKPSEKSNTNECSRKKQQPKKKQQQQPKSKLPCNHRTNTKVSAAVDYHQHNEKTDLKRKDENAYGTILVDRRIQQKQIDIGESPFYKLIPDHPSDILVPFSKIDPSKRLAETTVDPDKGKQHPILVNDLTSVDILLGRGGLSNNHEGNLWFRDLVSHYRTAYHRSAKGQKKLLAQNLCLYVRRSGGRFLAKDEGDARSAVVCFFECGDGRAQAKCAQALREVGSSEGRTSSLSPRNAAAAVSLQSTPSTTKKTDAPCKPIAPPEITPTANGKEQDQSDSSIPDEDPPAAAQQDHDGTNTISSITVNNFDIDSASQVLVSISRGDKNTKRKRQGASQSSFGAHHHQHQNPGDKQDGKRLRTAVTLPKAWSIYDTSSY